MQSPTNANLQAMTFLLLVAMFLGAGNTAMADDDSEVDPIATSGGEGKFPVSPRAISTIAKIGGNSNGHRFDVTISSAVKASKNDPESLPATMLVVRKSSNGIRQVLDPALLVIVRFKEGAHAAMAKAKLSVNSYANGSTRTKFHVQFQVGKEMRDFDYLFRLLRSSSGEEQTEHVEVDTKYVDLETSRCLIVTIEKEDTIRLEQPLDVDIDTLLTEELNVTEAATAILAGIAERTIELKPVPSADVDSDE